MKKITTLIVLILFSGMMMAQKNVLPVSQTQMLNLQLPQGSKQDKRLLSVAAAGSFLSMSSEFKNLEFTPVEVYSIPATSGFKFESVRSQLAANGFSEKFDNGDNKLLWFTRNNANWLVYLSQEAKEIILYIGQGNVSNIIVANQIQPVLIASAEPPAGNYPSYIPPLAGRQKGGQVVQKQLENKEMQNVVYDLDSNRYNVIKIGEQYWLKENLRTTQYNDTTFIAGGLSAQDWKNAKHGAYAFYDDNKMNIKKYGLLYNGYAVASGKLCPEGWHVATDEDWNELEKFLGVPESELQRTGERGNIADKLKNPGDWKASTFSANNSSGFSVFPAGSRLDNGEYSNLGEYGNFWTSTVYDDRYGLLYLWNHHVNYNTNALGRIYTVAQNGYSVRCVKDKPKPDVKKTK